MGQSRDEQYQEVFATPGPDKTKEGDDDARNQNQDFWRKGQEPRLPTMSWGYRKRVQSTELEMTEIEPLPKKPP